MVFRGGLRKDEWFIRQRLLGELMNPLDVDASRFQVAADGDHIVGFAQLKPIGDIYELASVYVAPAYRRRGLGSDLVERCLKYHVEAGRRLDEVYLLTLANFVEFYRRFGFEPVDDAPEALAFEIQLGGAVTSLIGKSLVCMRQSTGST